MRRAEQEQAAQLFRRGGFAGQLIEQLLVNAAKTAVAHHRGYDRPGVRF